MAHSKSSSPIISATRPSSRPSARLLQQPARDPLSWDHLGWFYRRSGDLARAIPALRESLAIDGSRARPRMMLANSLADLRKLDEAISEY
jgi:cytochrome c-type biogenesis protein CcmH/NrfG